VPALRRGTNLARIAGFNEAVIIDAIRRSKGGLSRVELTELTSLSAQTISNICRRMIEAGVGVGVQAVTMGFGSSGVVGFVVVGSPVVGSTPTAPSTRGPMIEPSQPRKTTSAAASRNRVMARRARAKRVPRQGAFNRLISFECAARGASTRVNTVNGE